MSKVAEMIAKEASKLEESFFSKKVEEKVPAATTVDIKYLNV
jgi:hypothetical protein